jgi:hypothetical protein
MNREVWNETAMAGVLDAYVLILKEKVVSGQWPAFKKNKPPAHFRTGGSFTSI